MEEAAHLNHETVMREAAVAALLGGGASSGDVFVDATFGGGGHSHLLLKKLPEGCRLIALDCDEYAAERAKRLTHPSFSFARCNYADMEDALNARSVGAVRGMLFDLGLSSMQLDSPERGFSFRAAGELDMRMDRRTGQTVAQWLRDVDEKTLAAALRDYGEEPEASRIAKALCVERGYLTTTAALAQAVVAAKKKPSPPGKHPATRVFQALRIAINHELQRLRQGLNMACDKLAVGGRLVVIAFHSLEDRIAKRLAVVDSFPGFGRVSASGLRQIGRMCRPSKEEIAANPRARSACMRVFVKTEVAF